MKNKGFTLVELAIVLVIIGLLVTAVLQGQELIKQAKIRKFIREVENYRLAITTFQTKYDMWPGVYNRADSTWPNCIALIDYENEGGGCNGDGGSYYINNPLEINGFRDVFYMWRQLSLSGMISKDYNLPNGYSDNEYLPYINYLSGILPASIMRFVPRTPGFPANTPSFNMSWEILPHTEDPNSPAAAAMVNTIRSIDTKVDDGNPLSGVMRATCSNPDNTYDIHSQSCAAYFKY